MTETSASAGSLKDGGWRNLGPAVANRIERGAGYEYCHVAADDHSRLPDAIILPDQKGPSAVEALEQVWGRYLRAGVRIKRILTDNGSCYRSLDFRAACLRLGIAVHAADRGLNWAVR